MKISIILNSRNRIHLLKELFGSLTMTTSIPVVKVGGGQSWYERDVEVLVSIDEDDLETQKYLEWISNGRGGLYDVRYEVIPRDTHLNNRLTGLSKQACGKYILILNDDTEILTPYWDRIAWESMETVSDEIVYGYTHCNSVDKEGNQFYSSFPIVSRKSVDILGYFMHPAFASLGADVHLWRIYDELNRVVDVPIQIRHSLHETIEQVINPDQTAAEMRNRAGRLNWWSYPIEEDVRKLNEEITRNL